MITNLKNSSLLILKIDPGSSNKYVRNDLRPYLLRGHVWSFQLRVWERYETVQQFGKIETKHFSRHVFF